MNDGLVYALDKILDGVFLAIGVAIVAVPIWLVLR